MRKVISVLALLSGAALAQPAATDQFLLRIEPTRAGFTLQNMTPEEAALATRHVRYLKSLLDAGKLGLAAQVFDPKGLWGIVIVNAPDLAAARALLEADPMVNGKTFRGEALPVRVVLQQPADSAPPAAVDAKTLEAYAGTYKSDQVPLDIKAFVKDGKLYVQAAGQDEIALKARSATEFEYAAARISIVFDSPSSFTLKQGPATLKFKKTVTP